MSRSLGRQICIQYVDLMWQITLMTVYYHLLCSLMKSVKKFPTTILFCYWWFVGEPGCPVTKFLSIDLRFTAPRMLGSRGTPSQFVLYGLKNTCAKFNAFTWFVTIFPLTDRTKLPISKESKWVLITLVNKLVTLSNNNYFTIKQN